MKKVLVIAPYAYLPYFSGGQKFIAQFLHYLAQQTDLTVISVPETDASLATGYKVIPMLKSGFSRYYDRSLIKKITELVKQQNFDAVIWEHPYYAWLAGKVKAATGVKTIIHTHNIEYQRFKSVGKWWWPLLQGYEKKALKKADAIFFITPEDRDFAVKNWGLQASKSILVPFGTDVNQMPADREEHKKQVCDTHNIPNGNKILLFTGLLNYKPNLDALNLILHKINPLPLKYESNPYTIIICGKGLPAEMNSLLEYKEQRIIYAGFISNVGSYYKAADVFLNPVQSGGGIKTKMVEAIAYGTPVISTRSGAAGMNTDVSKDKLIVVNDNDWAAFAEATMKVSQEPLQPTPPQFYRQYEWENIINHALVAVT